MVEQDAAPIAWTEVLETGVHALDEDHRALIAQCNALSGLMDCGAAWSEVVDSARGLARRCVEHFRSEEAVLDETGFPRRDLHKAQHRAMERRFDDLVGLLAAADGSNAEHRKAVHSLRATLVDILFRHDLDYKSHLQHIAGR
jgi:hemerythrin-like metal-binding protein